MAAQAIASAVFVCSPRHGGCSYVGPDRRFIRVGEEVLCPICHKDTAMSLNLDNFEELTSELSEAHKAHAQKLMDLVWFAKHPDLLKSYFPEC